MHRLMVLFLLVPLAACCQQPSPDSLYRSHQWFELSRATADGSGSALYRGAVASAFGEQPKAEVLLRSVIALDPHSKEAYEAHEWLTYLYLRAGAYREVVAETRAKVLARPERDSQAELSLMQAFRAFPDQYGTTKHSSRVQMSITHNDMVVPLSINGRTARFIVDSDANVSALSPAQARALGSGVQSSDAAALGATGSGASFSIAVARDLSIGANRLHNVAFQVNPDDFDLFRDLPLGSRGIDRSACIA